MNATESLVLARLIRAGEGFTSGEALGQELGISRAAISKTVAQLRALGYGIEAHPHRGYRIVERAHLLVAPEVHDGLGDVVFARTVHHVMEAASTQDIAHGLARAGAQSGTLVVAEVQTGGRGRRARPYVCPAGGVWCTLILRPPIVPAAARFLSLAAGVAVAEAVAETTGLEVMLKWPNDVLVGGRKVAGILTELVAEEQTVQYVLIGTGINANFADTVFEPELRERATTLLTEAGVKVSRRRLVQIYLECMQGLYDCVVEGRTGEVLARWKALPNTIGEVVTVSTGQGEVSGRAVDLDDSGRLVVELDDGRREMFDAAEVMHARRGGVPAR